MKLLPHSWDKCTAFGALTIHQIIFDLVSDIAAALYHRIAASGTVGGLVLRSIEVAHIDEFEPLRFADLVGSQQRFWRSGVGIGHLVCWVKSAHMPWDRRIE